MILDLDGAISEPSRRGHVAMTSAAVAAASLILLLLFVAPTPPVAPPQVASPLPSPGSSSVMTVVSDPTSTLPVDLMRSSVCSESTLSGRGPVSIDVRAAGEPSFVVIYDRSGRHPIAVMQEENGTERLILTCATATFASASTAWIPGGPFDESLRDAVTSTVCAVGMGSSPPVHLVLDANGRPVAAYTSGATGRFIALPRAYVGSGWLGVPCDTSDVFAPRLNRAR